MMRRLTKNVIIFICLLLCGLFNVSAQTTPTIVVNNNYRLQINAKGSIESFKIAQTEYDFLIPNHGNLPLFNIELRSTDSKYTAISSLDAKTVSINKKNDRNGEVITINYENIGPLNLSAIVTVRCPKNEALTYWNIEVNNPTTSYISHIQFPVVEVPFDKNPTPENSSTILSSLYDGVLSNPVSPTTVIGSWRRPRANSREGWRTTNYPRECTAQILAYYNANGGLYMASEDPNGLPKLISPMIEKDGVTMGFGHYPGSKGPSKYVLPYEVALGTFRGNWYKAADIYRNWASKQPFAKLKLSERTDIPDWLYKPTVAVTFPMRGQGDWDPPAAINPEYTPATNAIPYLDKLAKAFDASLMPIVFNWEKSGPWVQPEAFPPIGGEDAMKKFMKITKSKGWHPALYGNGINWVVAQRNTGYDGSAYFNSHGGDSAIVSYWWGKAKPTAGGWRSLYNTCVYTEPSRRMILGMTKGMADLGPSMIQQFDQGVGAVACYSSSHNHIPIPGPWMSTAFKSLIQEDNKIAKSNDPNVIIASEGSPPEVYLQDFQLWDARIGGGGSLNCSFYAYVYHEYIVAHDGSYLNSVNDEALRASVARAIVKGYMLNFTLRDKGRIAFEWNHIWDRAIPDQDGIIDWAKRATKFRFGIAKDFLIFGQMQQPYTITGVPTRDYGYGPEPLVQSETWKSQDGRYAVAMANYADNGQKLRIELPGTGVREIVITIDEINERRSVTLPYVLDVSLPSRSLALVELNK